MVDFIEISILEGFRAVPTGLRLNVVGAYPALKRGANNHCAYGAGDGLPFSKLAYRGQCISKLAYRGQCISKLTYRS